MPTRTTRSKVRYQPVLNLPKLPYDQFVALRDNIAVNGVVVPILTDGGRPVCRIIDGGYRKAIADELGYECPELVQAGLSEEEMRTLARALNLARRQLTGEQKRQLIADQLRETPDRSNRWVGKQLGVSHPTVASVRGEMEATGKVFQFDRTLGADGKYRPTARRQPIVHRPPAERQARIAAATLIHGDCRREMKKLPARSIDAILTDPIYPEVNKEYGRMTEQDWHAMMRVVVSEARRVLKPAGSMVVVLQPNSERVGRMRLWLWDFVSWAGREWNLVQDAYWWAVDMLPLGGIRREQGLMRPSVKMCVWLGPPDCYRNQANVLWSPSDALAARHRSDIALRSGPSGKTYRNSTIAKAADERGGTTPFNCLPIPVGGSSGAGHQHPAVTPYDLAAWWCRYVLPPGGVLCDPFCGSGTMLMAGLDHGASKVIGIDKEAKYLRVTRRRVEEG
jgi:hypothetical protein